MTISSIPVSGRRRGALACCALAAALVLLPACSQTSEGQTQQSGESQTQQQATGQSGSASTDATQSNGDIPADAVFTCEDALSLMQSEECCVIDLRVLKAYDQVHIDGAISMPASVVKTRIREVPTDKPVLIYSQKDEKLSDARAALIDGGIPEENIKVIQGGMDSWVAKDLPVIAEPHIGC